MENGSTLTSDIGCRSLEIRTLCKRYGEHSALHNFTFTFLPGLYWLLGPNGAGKSTLMNLIADVIPRTSGDIMYDGIDILSLGRSFRSRLGYMPQSQGFYERMTAAGFLAYMAEIKGVNKREAAEQIKSLLEMTNLYAVQHKKLHTLSGGMRQRVQLAQAMLGHPEILLLDEPGVGLDPAEQIRLNRAIEAAAVDKIVLVSTHMIGEIDNPDANILMMNHGQVAAVGTMRELRDAARQKRADTGDEVTVQEMYLSILGEEA